MVVSASSARKTPSATHLPHDPPPIPSRRPLTPSEKDNAAVQRRYKTKNVPSRYLSSHSSSTTSTSYSSNTTTTTSTSSSSSSSSRRFQSPAKSPAKRSQSVDRSRPDPQGSSAAARALCTTTRSLSVSFQGESFFYKTSKEKSPSPVASRKLTPERRRPGTPARNLSAEKPSEFHQRWPAARSRPSGLLTKSVECCGDKKSEFLATELQLLRQSSLFDGAELLACSDRESISSGSNSGTPEVNVLPRPPPAQIGSRCVGGPARFRHLSEPVTPVSSARRMVVDSPTAVSRSGCSPLKGPARPSSPGKVGGSPARVMGSSPSRARCSSGLASFSPAKLMANAPSILSFAAEVRRSRKGENRIEEAHMLRLLHNKHLQWRCVNARINGVMMVQRMDVEKNLYNECITISEVRDSVTIKKIKLQFMSQYLKLTTILKGQLFLLEDYSVLDQEHSSSLSGAIEELEASTLRLPVVSGARADLQDMKDAVGSAVDVMQAMGASIYSTLSKVEGTSSKVLELAKVALQEQALLDRSRNLLSTLAALHVKQCSLHGHLVQLKRSTSGILQL